MDLQWLHRTLLYIPCIPCNARCAVLSDPDQEEPRITPLIIQAAVGQLSPCLWCIQNSWPFLRVLHREGDRWINLSSYGLCAMCTPELLVELGSGAHAVNMKQAAESWATRICSCLDLPSQPREGVSFCSIVHGELPEPTLTITLDWAHGSFLCTVLRPSSSPGSLRTFSSLRWESLFFFFFNLFPAIVIHTIFFRIALQEGMELV